MCDSQVIQFNIKPNSNAFWKGGVIFETGVPYKFNSLYEYMTGLTKAKNQVSSIFDKEETFDVVAYSGSFNTPASLIGNNALIENLVYQSATANMLIVQKGLLDRGCDVDLVKQIRLDNSEFKSVTLTYLVECDSYESALKRVEELYMHADMVFCDHYESAVNGRGKSKGKKKNVVPKGTAPERTIYFNKFPDFKVTVYIKAGKHGRSHADFRFPEEQKAVYEISSRCIRLEIKLGYSWLIRNGLHKPINWKNKAGPIAYKLALDELRTKLRVDDHFRVNEPQERHLEKLSQDAKDVLEGHLRGERLYKIGSLQISPSEVPIGIRKQLWGLGIDINFPWAVQSKKASNEIRDWLVWNGPFKAPDDLEHISYVRPTVKQKIKDLKQQVNELMARSSSRAGSQKKIQTMPPKWSAVLSDISNHLNGMYAAEHSTETSDISNLMG